MATSRRTIALAGLLVVGLAGCGAEVARAPSVGSGFGWLGSGQVPTDWRPAGVLAGGTLSRPPGWSTLSGDRGTVSFAQLQGDTIVGYLNATPRQGSETLDGWRGFRLVHNAHEGDRAAGLIVAASRLRVGRARVSCVIDSYRTSQAEYRELDCLIARPRGSAVVVGAAPPARWTTQRPVIERAIAGFLAS